MSLQGKILVKEVACFQESLDSDDVFIFDAGLELYQVHRYGLLIDGQTSRTHAES